MYRATALALKSKTPFPVPPYLIASRTNRVRGTIGLVDMLADMNLREEVREMFLDGFLTVNRSFRRHLNRVLREERGHSDCIVVVECLVELLIELIKRLDCFWISRLLGNHWESKPDCQPCKGK